MNIEYDKSKKLPHTIEHTDTKSIEEYPHNRTNHSNYNTNEIYVLFVAAVTNATSHKM